MDQSTVSYQFDKMSKIKYYLGVIFDRIDIAVNSSRIAFNKLCKDQSELIKLDIKSYRQVA